MLNDCGGTTLDQKNSRGHRDCRCTQEEKRQYGERSKLAFPCVHECIGKRVQHGMKRCRAKNCSSTFLFFPPQRRQDFFVLDAPRPAFGDDSGFYGTDYTMCTLCSHCTVLSALHLTHSTWSAWRVVGKKN